MTQQWRDPNARRPVDINAYAPPRRSGATLWLLLVGAVAVGVVLAALLWRPAPPEAAPTASPTAQASSNLPGMPFTMPASPDDQGRWEVLGHTWTGNAVDIRVRVTCDAGSISYGFVAFSNAGTDVYEPAAGAPDPEIGSGSLAAGGSVEGNIRILLPRGDATLILTTSGGQQISALPVPG
ncbi:hypothetical protein [Propioniciclava soli]|uniref:DUF4352 domain-containing protein n=1 Tax=Propioniciclava soli TaxID=2775081 RepID=A0ABZ3C3G9_9ACTN|nr:hypothetical protein [Propioniciclava soli]